MTSTKSKIARYANPSGTMHWHQVGSTDSFPQDEGVNIKYGDQQVAIFNFSRKNKWYACQNLCPHRQEMVLSRSILGDDNGEPKIACPLHKNTFSLESGKNLNGNLCSLKVYPVKAENGFVYVGFHPNDHGSEPKNQSSH